MSQVSVAEAARLVGQDRKSLYRAIKQGRLTATVDATGGKQIDVAELLRVYGPFSGVACDTHATVATPQDAPQDATASATRIAALEAEVASLKERLSDKDANLADLRQAIKLLEHKRPATENHRPWWRTLLGRD